MQPVAPHAYSSRGSRRSRIAGALLALIVAAIIVLMLILSGFLPQVFAPMGAPALATFDVSGGSQTPSPSPQPKPEAKAAAKQAAKPPPRTETPPTPIVPIKPIPGMIVLSSDEFAGSDIGKIKGTATVGTGDKGNATADSGAVYGPGAGPGGKQLYAAQWVREPTHAELAFYMPKNRSEGWATISCRTIERYHVDNCQVLGESPGSGIGSALRQAAWQFLVLPPRVNGRPMIGTWVRIRFDLVKGLQR